MAGLGRESRSSWLWFFKIENADNRGTVLHEVPMTPTPLVGIHSVSAARIRETAN